MQKAPILILLMMIGVVALISWGIYSGIMEHTRYVKEHTWTHEGVLKEYSISAGGFGHSDITTFKFEDGRVIVIDQGWIDPTLEEGNLYRISWYQKLNGDYRLISLEELKKSDEK